MRASRSRAATPIALAALIALACAWLLTYARGADTYYRPQEYSRWDHARGDSMWLWVVAFFVIGGTAILGLVADAFGRLDRLRRAVYAAAAATPVLLLVALFALTAGH